MNQEYARMKEADCIAKMSRLNDEVLHLEGFSPTPEKYHADASGLTRTSEQVIIEIKDRNMTMTNDMRLRGTSGEREYYASDLYIEAHKMADMLLDYVTENKTPLYVNFTEDSHAIVYNLSRLKERPKTVAKRIYSELYGGFELSKRICLPLSEAWIWKMDDNGSYELLQKPQQP